MVPLEVLLSYAWPFLWVETYAGLGVGARLTAVGIDEANFFSALPSGNLILGASHPLGPGSLFVETSVGVGSLPGNFATVRATMLLTTAGYRIRP